MSAFKDMIADDISIFMNLDENAELHTISTINKDNVRTDREIPIIIDMYDIDGRPSKSSEGVSAHTTIIYVEAKALWFVPRVDQLLFLNLNQYMIIDASPEGGIWRLTLKKNGMRP
ncbi:hypothetical protein HW560_15690 [Paenibacillus sp. E222]|uniref:hypothetical protein n=1 Tax=Paenibacillus sp. E222 TaxID=2748863 RepID=UPI0015C5D9F9|nr:hypothetical protein [Paenibacillus sp. E222]QLG39389.1 hypothetical protein HW560_15690 [Paenibacillus sp. E222]